MTHGRHPLICYLFCRNSQSSPPVQPPVRQPTFPQQPPTLRNDYQRQESRESFGRPTSSIYSQPSISYSQHSALDTNPPYQREQLNVHRHQPGNLTDVSPPSSPELPAYGNVYVYVSLDRGERNKSQQALVAASPEAATVRPASRGVLYDLLTCFMYIIDTTTTSLP